MNENFMRKTASYEAPIIYKQVVELEQVIANSGKARMKVSANATDSSEESWVDKNLSDEYNIDF